MSEPTTESGEAPASIIDLRSDTVSRPSREMRQAMAEAEVGDDVFGDDPTVNRLEAMAAELMGKEAAVYVPSGTMGNTMALLAHTEPGDEVLLGGESHIFNYEVGAVARLGGLLTHPLPNLSDGSISAASVAAAVREPNIHAPRTRLLTLENTHNRCGGAALPMATMDALTATAHEHGMLVHLDGARIFNAQAALGEPAARIARDCDTVSFCLSKGLGAPVGSLLCGSADDILQARRARKMLGGGMRQAGIIAAAGIYALEHNIERLAEDHTNAKRLANGLARFEAFRVPVPQTNIVVLEVIEGTVAGWVERFAEAGVLCVPFGPTRIRMVTHINISAEDIEEALRRATRAVEAVRAAEAVPA